MFALIDKGRILAAAVAIIAGGCTVSASASPPPTAPGSSAAPSAPALASPAPTVSPTSKPTPLPATWSKPGQVGTAANCASVTAGIDTASRFHVAASCGGSIVYSATNSDGSWSSQVFAHPTERLDLAPQIAFEGTTVYVAYTRVAVGEGCGSGLIDVGVYYRHTMTDGSWTDPRRIGEATDALESFRVAGGTIHATVRGSDGDSSYETLTGSTYNRYPLTGGQSSMRVGTDGRARIAYFYRGELKYARFTGSGFSTTTIGGSRGDDQQPTLALDRGNHAHLLWTRKPLEGGCVSEPPTPEDGTYYATNATGTWVSGRITTNKGATSIQVDEVTGQVHVLVAGSGVRYYAKSPGGPWRGAKVTSAEAQPDSAAIRLDPATGRLLIVYLTQQSNGLGKVYAITKP